MANVINMPKLGLTMTEGTVLWKKQVGDPVKVGDVVFEVETDKLTNEVESEFEGVLLQQMCEEGGEIACTETVAVIGAPGEKVEGVSAPVVAAAEETVSVPAEAPAEVPSQTALPAGCVTIVMPKLGLTMTEGTVTWKKQVGDEVKPGDVVFEVETDKLTNEVEANEDCNGVLLQQMCEDGGEVPCTQPVAVVGPAGTVVNLSSGIAPAAVKETVQDVPATTAAVVKAAASVGGYIFASPIAKKLAKDNGLNLADIPATGPNGRIVMRDVEAFMASNKVKMSPTAAKMAAEMGVDVKGLNVDGRVMKNDVLSAVQPAESAASAQSPAQDQTVKLTKMRKTIAKRMSESWNTSPRVSYNLSVDTTAMKELKEKLTPVFKEAGIKLTFNHILMKVCAKVLVEIPEINGSLEGDLLLLHPHVNIGMAVGMDNGLVVPNIKACEEKSLMQIAKDTEEAINKARTNKLTPDELTGGTFTITNLGMFGMESFSPIINQPELAILGVNTIIETPVVINGEITIRPMMNLSFVADHRVIDGVKAAQCLKKIKTYLENPYLLLA